jgi:hypothetical protein
MTARLEGRLEHQRLRPQRTSVPWRLAILDGGVKNASVAPSSGLALGRRIDSATTNRPPAA